MPKRAPKQEGMSWLNPMIVVKDVQRSLDFYEKAFGFKTKMTMPDKTGKIMHAEMQYKDNVFMMGPESEQFGTKSPNSFKGTPVSFYIYVENVDNAYDKAKKAGAKELQGLTNQYWGDRTCTFNCPEGHKWMLAQNVGDFDPKNVPM